MRERDRLYEPGATAQVGGPHRAPLSMSFGHRSEHELIGCVWRTKLPKRRADVWLGQGEGLIDPISSSNAPAFSVTLAFGPRNFM